MQLPLFVTQYLDEKFAGVTADIEALKTLLNEQRKLFEEFRALNSRLDVIEKSIDGLQSRITQLTEKPSVPSHVAAGVADRMTPASNTNFHQSPVSARHEAAPSVPTVEIADVTATFYARGNSDGVLTPVPDSFAADVPFVITATGDKATVKFNDRCAARLLPSAEAKLLPYFDYEIAPGTGIPTAVHGLNSVSATRQGDKWVLNERIKITIS